MMRPPEGRGSGRYLHWGILRCKYVDMGYEGSYHIIVLSLLCVHDVLLLGIVQRMHCAVDGSFLTNTTSHPSPQLQSIFCALPRSI
jgi:hypothetical protein